jgi:regulator of replication initiation timing
MADEPVPITRTSRDRNVVDMNEREIGDRIQAIDDILAKDREQVRVLKHEIASLREERQRLRAELSRARATSILSAEQARSAFVLKVMACMDQDMTVPEAARHLGRSEAAVHKAIATFRREQDVPKRARRRRPMRERRTLT